MEEPKNDTMFIGLSAQEALRRQKMHGLNIVFEKKRMGPVVNFLNKLKSPLLILLIIISVVSYALGQRVSATIVLMMVFLSATLDFFNSYKSQKAVEKLVSRVSVKVAVFRNSRKMEIDCKDLVPGDIFFLSAGSIVPADGKVLESDDFFVNESALTGESIPVEKIPLPEIGMHPADVISECCPQDTVKLESRETEKPGNRHAGIFDNNKIMKLENQSVSLSGRHYKNEVKSFENKNKVLTGTSVISGYATIEAVSTGSRTEFGKIARNLSQAKQKTDIEVSIMKFSVFIMKLVMVIVSIVFIIYLIKNVGHLTKNIILEAFAFALAITIGVTPDMLPAIMTVCLAKGSQLMAKKKVIVKRLQSIENFGSMDILCTDKTGTLTQDHIALVKYIDYTGADCAKVLQYGYLSSVYHTGVPNPLDRAIKEYRNPIIAGYEKVDEIPYDFERRRSSMVVRIAGSRFLITKGAPEEVLKICSFSEFRGRVGAYADEQNKIYRSFQDLSQEGFRVLALCYKELPDDSVKSYRRDVETDMTFLGFLAFLDPPKEGVKETIDELENLGVGVKILTGDNELLTQKICREIDIDIRGVITGQQVEGMDDLALNKAVLDANIFARVTPEQKERIILALKKSGFGVGYLGDGINDAPALRAADVGISVNNAVDIAKDTADIILIRKSLKSLKDGVIEGRKTFHNTLKYLMMGLSSNFGNIFSMMGAAAFLPFLPMLPSQILLNNFIYDVAQFSLPSDNVDNEELLKPAHWDLKFIRSYMMVFGWLSSIFDFFTFFLLYYVYRLSEHQFQTGWFLESIATQVFVIYIIRTKKVPFLKSRPSRALLYTTILAVVAAWLIPYTIIGGLLKFEPLPLIIMAIIASYVLAYLVLVEIGKRVFYRYYKRKIKIVC